MSGYIDVPFDTNPDDLVALFFDYLQSKVPGWQPNDGNFETITGEGISLIASVIARLASGQPTSIFRWFGPLAGINPIDAAPASVQTTWTARDTQGYSIAAGTIVGIRTAGDQLVPFAVLNPVDIPSGEASTGAGAVTIVAVAAGAAGSGLGSIGGPVELVDPLDWVSTITQVDITTGGVDAESDVDFLNRLRADLALQSPRPILPPDFAALGRTVPGVARVVAIDGYNPGDDTFSNPRMIAVAGMDAAGNALGAPAQAALDAYLQGLREVNFIVNVIDPTVTEIDVFYAITVNDGFDPAATVKNVTAAITAWLSASNWGVPPNGDPAVWDDDDQARYLELAHVILRTPGVAFIDYLYLNAHVALGTFTVTIASPGVFNKTAHGLAVNDTVYLETTGALPGGLAADVVYFVHDVVDADHFKLKATAAGGAINTSGTQSGTHSIYRTGESDVTLDGPASLPHAHRITGSHT